MDKARALQAFWNRFLLAYEDLTIPDTATLPYITYSGAYASLDEPVGLSANVWYRSPSWADAKKKAQEIGEAIGRGGVVIPFNDGAIWITRGIPFSQPMDDPEDDMIRRMYLNVMVEYLSQD